MSGPDTASTVGEEPDRAARMRVPGPRSTTGRRVAAAAAVVVVLVGAGVAWRLRDAGDPPAGAPATGAPLPIPADPTGPVPAANTAASPGDPSSSSPARWDVVRTGADDHQLVVFFEGGGCGTYRAAVAETSDSISIAVFPVAPGDGRTCLTIAGPGAIGVELSQPLGARRLVGSRPIDGSGVAEPLVVRGPDLATLTWPPGSVRAASEDLHRGTGPDSFVWTQRFEGPADEDGSAPAVMLEQWHGATAIDHGALFQACGYSEPTETERVDVGGTDAMLARCSDASESPERSGAIAVVWMDGSDRFMVRAEPGTTELDAKALVALAASVRTGG